MTRLLSPLTLPLLCISLVLSACGFHLRGEANLPSALQTMVLLSQSGQVGFDRDLRTTLSRSGVTLLDESDTHLDLVVNRLQVSDTTIARASDNDVTQLERRLTVSYYLRNPEGKVVFGPRNVSATTVLSNQDGDLSTVEAYNAQQMELLGQQLASLLVYDLSYAPL